MLQTCYVDENHYFLTYSAKIPAKISCFYDFFSEKLIYAIYANFHVYVKFPRVADFMTSQWRHMKLNGTNFGING